MEIDIFNFFKILFYNSYCTFRDYKSFLSFFFFRENLLKTLFPILKFIYKIDSLMNLNH
jgi:hypothetical protein